MEYSLPLLYLAGTNPAYAVFNLAKDAIVLQDTSSKSSGR